MSTETTYHCDGPNCDTWARQETAAKTFLAVVWDHDTSYYCSTDCLLREYSKYPPVETINQTY